MKDDVQTIRKRLQDLHEHHTTGFVDDKQYAESLQVLERRLINAVMEDEPAAALPQEAPVDPVRAEPVLANAVASTRWVRWLVAAVLVHLLVGGIYWWTSSRAPQKPLLGEKASVEPADQLPAHDRAAASVPAAASAAVIEAAPSTTAAVMTPGATSISGTVTLAPALADRARASDTVFVYARAIDGPSMPLAVIRKQVKDLPLVFKLDDSMATWPAARVSAFPRIVVTARVSKSGEGPARDGDLLGESPVVAAGVAGLVIEIGRVVEKSPRP